MSRWEPPLWFDRLGGVAWRGVVIVVAVVLLVAGIVGLGAVIVPVVLGLLFTMRPAAGRRCGCGATRHARGRWPPALSVLVLTVALVGVVWLTVNAVVDQWPEIETLIDEARDTLTDDGRGQRRRRRDGGDARTCRRRRRHEHRRPARSRARPARPDRGRPDHGRSCSACS